MNELPQYVSERIFDAAPSALWSAWSDPDLLAQWYGPGVETIIHELNVIKGGFWLNEMRMKGISMCSRASYLDVRENEKLVMVMETTDENWTPTQNPMMPDWPALLTTVTFEAIGDKTKQTLIWTPHEANAAQIACFAGGVSGMGKGWDAGFDIMAGLLAG